MLIKLSIAIFAMQRVVCEERERERECVCCWALLALLYLFRTYVYARKKQCKSLKAIIKTYLHDKCIMINYKIK